MKEARMHRTQTSPVWSYFKVCEEDPVQADCLLCGIRMSRGGSSPTRCGTTNLRRHILFSHKMSLPTVKNGGPKVSNVKSTKKLLKKKQPPRVKHSTVTKKNDSVSNKLVKNGELKKSVMLAEKVSEKERLLRDEIDWLSSHPQADPVMCIKWNTYLSNMTTTLPNLLNDEQFVDVTLSCEGQSLKCHKIVLAACSPYFLELLGGAACRHPIIIFKDYRFWELQALVSFMYCGEVNVPQSQLSRILRVAEALQVKGLAKPASGSSDNDSVSEEGSLPLSPYSSDQENLVPTVPESPKRKRKPSSLSCCKNHPRAKNVKSMPKKQKVKSLLKTKYVKSRSSQEPSNKKQSPAKKRKHTLAKAKKTVKKKLEAKGPQPLSDCSPSASCSHLPELLASDLPDMLSDILTSNMMDGISLPEALREGSVDGSFPLQHFDPGNMELGEEDTPFLANGLTHDLLNINSECKEADGR